MKKNWNYIAIYLTLKTILSYRNCILFTILLHGIKFIFYSNNILLLLLIFFFYSMLLQRFKDNDIEVKRKDGIILLRELSAEVKNFMDFKRNAVMVSEILL